MSHLAIYMFGGFRAEMDGNPLTVFGTDKNRALLAYLAIESRRPHRREALATLLWPNRSEAEARNNLRQAIYQLRHILVQGTETETHLLITTGQVQFNPASDHWIDVSEFKGRLSACQAHHPAGLSLCTGCMESLQRAIDLFRGEMLEGFTLPRCTGFTDWQIINQEACHLQVMAALSLLADYFETNHAYDQLIVCTHRKIELEPWRESAHRRQMWALAMNGRRAEALQQYGTLRDVLRRELGIPPTNETRQLYELIRENHLPSPHLPPVEPWRSFTPADQQPDKAGAPLFVARQPELAQLQRYLRDSLAGHGRVAFVSGEAGSGKTALFNEFARWAMRAQDDLLVASGTCSAYGGLGDSYQPFREVLETLAGVSDAPRAGPGISTEQALRLSAALSTFLQTLLETSPGLAFALLPAQELLRHARKATGLDAATVARLEALAAYLDSGGPAATRPVSQMASPNPRLSFMKQPGLFDQVSRLLVALSHRFPLLILLDDLQWSDRASASLLFHLGGSLSGGRILLLGAYRPEDIATAGNWKRHPLVAVINEFQRRFGEIQVDLSRADGQAFTNAYLDSEPNQYDQDFRETLFRYTHGNALFTVELLRAMKERGEVVQDKTTHWVQGPRVDWEQLPARVEAVIAERLGRLDRECHTLLESASVQGEVFIAEVLAKVLGVTEEAITTRLSGPLCKQHRLVSSLGLASQDSGRQTCYQFRHFLYQKYLYQGLDEVERRRLHRATADALERLYTAQNGVPE